MTREDKLFSMRMKDLIGVAEKIGIKINKKGSKEKAVEKILEAEKMIAETDKIKEEKEVVVNLEKSAEEETKAQYAEQENNDQDDWEDSSYEEKKENAAKSDAEAEAAINKKKREFNETPPEKKTRPGKGAQLEYKGKSQNICAWARELGISANTLYGRIYKMGWSIEKAFETLPKC